MKVEIRNLQTIKKPRSGNIRELVLFFLQRARDLAPAAGWNTFSFVLTDNDILRKLNGVFLKRHQTTDVIAFRFVPMSLDSEAFDGEVIVNVERAIEVGPRWGNLHRELALYLAHGCDHLTGAADIVPADRSRMRRRELRWLKQAISQGLPSRLFYD